MSIYSAAANIYNQSPSDHNRRSRTTTDPRMFLQAQQERKRAERWENALKPVEWIFDRLSTGNYLAANIVDQAIKTSRGLETDLPQALIGSFTGEGRKTFRDVITEHAPGSDDSWMPELKDSGTFTGNILGNLNTAGVVGFGLDVVLDPLNWITFGATKKARLAAKTFADESVKMAMKDPQTLTRAMAALNPNDATTLQGLINDPRKMMQFLSSKKGVLEQGGVHDMARTMNNIWKDRYREGLRMSSDEMKKSLLGMFSEVQSKTQKSRVQQAVNRYQTRMAKPYQRWLQTQSTSDIDAIKIIDPEGYKQLMAAQNASGGGILDVHSFTSTMSPNTFGSSPIEAHVNRLNYIKSDSFGQSVTDTIQRFLKGEIPISEIPDELYGAVQDIVSQGKKPSFESLADMAEVKDFVNAVSEGAGRSAFRVFNKSIGSHLRKDNPALRTYDTFRSALRSSYTDSRLQDAVWGIIESGPVGSLRQMFGFRNPYQKALRTLELERTSNMRYLTSDMEKKVNDIFSGVSEEAKQSYFTFRANAQDANRALSDQADRYARHKLKLGEINVYIPDGKIAGGRDMGWELARDIPDDLYPFYKEHVQEFLSQSGSNPLSFLPSDMNSALRDEISTLHKKVESFMRSIDAQEAILMESGLLDFRESLDNYLPHIFRRTKEHVAKTPTSTRRVGSSSTLHQEIGPLQAVNRDLDALSLLYGIDAQDAARIIKQNGGTVVTDLHELLLRRGMHHVTMVGDATLLDSLRQFGIDINEIGAMAEMGRDAFTPTVLSQLGLQDITGNYAGAFSRSGSKGYHYYFDKDVARVIERITSLHKDPGYMKSLIGGYTNWWRGIATSSPGFHIRNWYSNYAMMYSEFGPKAFNPEYVYDGLIGGSIGLKGIGAIQEAGEQAGQIALRMQKHYGPWSVQELIGEAKKRGVFSESSRGFLSDDPIRSMLGHQDRSKVAQALKDYSPLSSTNKFFQVSKNTGALIESSTRFQTFLMEITELTSGGNITDKVSSILDAAAQTSKRVLLDYTDLTPFEQDVMRNIVPFYTWIRKNIANQMFILHNPQMWGNVATTPKLIEMFKDPSIDESDLPNYMRSSGMFAIGRDGDGKVMTAWPNIPVFDLNMLPVVFDGQMFGAPVFHGRELFRQVSNMAHPLIKSVAEQGMGVDVFRDRQIQPTEQANRYLGLIMRFPKAFALLDPLVAAGNNGVGFVAGIDQDGVMQLNGKLVRGVETMFPLLNALNRYIQIIESTEHAVFETSMIRDAVNAAMGANDPQTTAEQTLRTLSFALGIKVSSYDEDEARLWRGLESYNRVLDARRAEEELGPLRNHRRVDWMNRNRRTLRRLGLYR